MHGAQGDDDAAPDTLAANLAAFNLKAASAPRATFYAIEAIWPSVIS